MYQDMANGRLDMAMYFVDFYHNIEESKMMKIYKIVKSMMIYYSFLTFVLQYDQIIGKNFSFRDEYFIK